MVGNDKFNKMIIIRVWNIHDWKLTYHEEEIRRKHLLKIKQEYKPIWRPSGNKDITKNEEANNQWLCYFTYT